MNDRFKFRGCMYYTGELVNELVYGSLLQDKNGWHIVMCNASGLTFVKIIDGSQEQCIGREDKNGKLMYEGDVINEGGVIGKIEWMAGEDCWAYTNRRGRTRLYMFAGEVIGNIHENPELLEGGS